jgi:diguanylate cyclase (GGDEF)-like protein
VLLIIAGLLGSSAAVWSLRLADVTRTPLTPALHWWLLAPLFAFTEVVVLHVQVRREAQTISLSEIPLVMALFLANPTEMAVAAVLGPAIVYLAIRRQTFIKALFNTSLRLFGVTLILVIFQCGDPLAGTTSDWFHPLAWLAAIAAVAVAGGADGLLLLIVIAVHDGIVTRRDLIMEGFGFPLVSALVGCVGVVSVTALHADPWVAIPLIFTVGALFAGYREHSELSQRHSSLTGLFTFGRAVTRAERLDDILGSVLEGARDLLRAESAEVVLPSSDPGQPPRRWVLAANSSEVTQSQLTDGHQAVWSSVMSGGGSVLLGRGEQASRNTLAPLGHRDAIIVPLLDDSGVIGTLMVADRLGEVRTFTSSDAEMLETLAYQASLALQNGRLMDRLRYDAMHDVLTGLPNRAAFRIAADEQLQTLDDGRAEAFAILLIDLDGFKEVNDSLGHHSGDALLIHVAERLLASASPGATVARLGGDEFAILLPLVRDSGPVPSLTAATEAAGEAAAAAADRIAVALGEHMVIDGVPVQIGASIGISLAPAHARDVTNLLRQADHAMYEAKAHHGGAVFHREDDVERSGQSRLALLAELRQAIVDRQIVIHVQPQARADTGALVGVEALIRWNHPTLGALAPSEFLPLAQRYGLMPDLTALVLDQAVAAASDWRAHNLDLTIAVNLTPDYLVDPRMLECVETTLRRHHLPPSRLVLEITEDTVISDPARTIARLNDLRAAGVQLSVDDFGTGYSSLSYLRRLPVNEVKIDRSFTSSLATDSDDQAIVRSIIDLANNLSLDVVAEGVENQETWQQLASFGCHRIQGHHLATPMPVGDLRPWLQGYESRLATIDRGLNRRAMLRAVPTNTAVR